MALLAPWAAKADGTLTVHDGSATNGYVPVEGYWADNYLKCEIVYPASELDDMNGQSILNMTWYLSSPAPAAWTGTFQIFMKEVAETSISAYSGTEGATVVYEGTLDGTASTLLVEFDTPYAYSGGNLLIGVYQTTKGNYKSATFAGETVDGASVQGHNSALASVTANQRNFIPKTTFSYGTPPSCVKPTGLAATLTPGDGTVATLNWTAGGTETAWVLEYGTASDFTGATSVNVSGTPSKNLTGLTAEATYYARVKADCGGGETSDWSATCEFTPTNTYNLTINDGSTTNGLVPVYGSWVDNKSYSQFIIPATALSTIQWGTINKLTFYSSSESASWSGAKFEVYMTETGETTLAALADWASMTKVMNEAHLEISGNQMVVTLDTPFQYMGSNLMVGIKQTVSGTYSGAYFYGVTATGASMGGYGSSISQQNFLPKTTFTYLPGEEPTCFIPTALAYSEVGKRQATLSWTENGEATAWQICVNGDEAHPVAANTNPFVLTGLEPETEYTVKVRAYCDAEDQSDWSSPVSFTTLVACPTPTALAVSEITTNSAKVSWTSENDNFDLRYAALTSKNRATLVYNFDDSDLEGWTTIDADGDGYSWEISTSDPTSYYTNPISTGSGHNSSLDMVVSGSYSNLYGALTPDNYLVSPQINLGGSITFWAAAQQHDYPEEHFGVAVSMGSNTNDDDFTTIQEWTMTAKAQGNWYEYTVDLSAYSGEGYVAIRHFNCTDQFILLVDDITIVEGSAIIIDWTTLEDVSNPYVFPNNLIKETNYLVQVRSNCGGDDGSSDWTISKSFQTLPTCLVPTGLTVSEITGTTAKLSWTENGEATSWQICINDDLVHLVDADNNPFTLTTGLTPETECTVKVRAYCDSDDQSAWSTPISFTPTYYKDYTYNSTANLNYTYYIPFYGNYVNTTTNKSQFIVPATAFPVDMVDASVRRFTYYSNVNNANFGTAVFSIYVKEVENTSFESAEFVDWESLTEVYSGTLSVSGGKMVIALPSEFVYRGGNLLIGFDMTASGTSVDARWTYSNGSSYSGVYQYSTYDASRSQANPKITFNYRPTSTPRPTALQTKEILSTEATLAWIAPTADGVTGYEYSYKLSTSDVWSSDEVNDTIVNITGLTQNKTYDFRVRAKYGVQYSQYATIQFETPAACPIPTNLAATNLTQNSADLSWTASVEVDDYTVQYRIAEQYEFLGADFEDGIIPSGWTSEGASSWTVSNGYDGSTVAHSGSKNAKITHTTRDNVTYLVTPKIDLSSASGLNIHCWFVNKAWGSDIDGFGVYYRINGGAWNEIFSTDEAHSDWTEVDEALPAGAYAANCQFGFKMTDDYGYGVGLDDVTLGNLIPASAWTEATTTAPNTGVYTITGPLTAGTKYDVRVASNCNMTYCEPISFTTLAEHNIVFPDDGTWAAGNFEPTGAPGIDDDVIIRADVNIPDGTNAQANNINLENGAVITVASGATLTINGNVTNGGNDKIIVEDGGQVIVSKSGIRATLKKSVSNTAKDAKPTWYTISTPVSITYASSVINLISSTDPGFNYDLYYYQETTRLWKNYKNSSFYINNGKGYLYWNSTGSELSFPGTMNYGNVSVTLTKTVAEPTDDLEGFNLIGNPYPHNIYKGAGTAIENSVAEGYVLATGFYTLSNSDEWVAGTDNSTAIKPAQGILVQATTAGTLTIQDKTASGAKANNDNIKFSIANSQFEDVTYALFMDEIGLTKINHRNADAPMIYIPQDGENFAIATMGDDTETFGLNFKAMTTGMYTLSAKADGNYSYLHVIDRLTGEDIDMLVDGKYEFIGSPRDNEARFIVKLRYNANGFNNDEFIYQNGDELIVNGEGELQVYDVMGRYVACYNVNGNKRISAEQFSNAVYIFRLVGSDVKTQKIVVR